MKKVTLALTFAITPSSNACSASCIAIDYQEMKKITVRELLYEACATNRKAVTPLDASIGTVGRRDDNSSQSDFEKC